MECLVGFVGVLGFLEGLFVYCIYRDGFVSLLVGGQGFCMMKGGFCLVG